MLIAKYGAVFAKRAEENVDNCVNEKVIARLSLSVPQAGIIQTYIDSICEENNIPRETFASSTPLYDTVPSGFDVPAMPQMGGAPAPMDMGMGMPQMGMPQMSMPQPQMGMPQMPPAQPQQTASSTDFEVFLFHLTNFS